MITIRLTKKGLIIVTIIILFVLLVIMLSLVKSLEEGKRIFEENIPKATLVSSNNNKVQNNNINNDNNIVDEEIQVSNVVFELSNLTNKGWDFREYIIDGEYEVEGYDYHYKDGFTLTRKGNKIQRIVFNYNYNKEIFTGIYPGMSIKDAQKVLGKPAFENKELDMIGYATQNFYLCIYNGEIAIYQNEYYGNQDLEEMIVKYYLGEIQATDNEFSKYIRNTYDDFEFSSDEEKNIYLTSETRGMVIKIDDTINLTLYKEYDKTSSNLLDNNMFENIEYKDQYMIEVIENERN